MKCIYINMRSLFIPKGYEEASHILYFKFIQIKIWIFF